MESTTANYSTWKWFKNTRVVLTMIPLKQKSRLNRKGEHVMFLCSQPSTSFSLLSEASWCAECLSSLALTQWSFCAARTKNGTNNSFSENKRLLHSCWKFFLILVLALVSTHSTHCMAKVCSNTVSKLRLVQKLNHFSLKYLSEWTKISKTRF